MPPIPQTAYVYIWECNTHTFHSVWIKSTSVWFVAENVVRSRSELRIKRQLWAIQQQQQRKMYEEANESGKRRRRSVYAQKARILRKDNLSNLYTYFKRWRKKYQTVCDLDRESRRDRANEIKAARLKRPLGTFFLSLFELIFFFCYFSFAREWYAEIGILKEWTRKQISHWLPVFKLLLIFFLFLFIFVHTFKQ